MLLLTRGNRAFAQITADDETGACAAGYAGCESPVCTPTTCGVVGTASHGSDWWTPPPLYRGFVARATMYMAVRYDGQESNTHDLQLGDTLSAPADSAGGGVYTFGKLADLLLWHQTYPVAAWETARNDAVCAQQGNRNPFTVGPGGCYSPRRPVHCEPSFHE